VCVYTTYISLVGPVGTVDGQEMTLWQLAAGCPEPIS